MNCKISILLLFISATMNAQNITYPKTKKVNQIDTYFGTEVLDPYRWLEDDRSAETEAWVKEQNQVTFDYLSKISFRDKLKKRMEYLWNYEKISAPFKEGSYTYFYKNNGLQNQAILYRKDKNGKEEVFLNPNTFSKDGTTSLASVSFSKDGTLVAYAVSEGGSDWRKVIVLNTETKEIIGDTLIDVKFSGLSWYKNEGFYYSSYDKPQGSELSAKTDQHKLYYHQIGAKQSEDKVVFGNEVKKRYVGGYVTQDDLFLIITAANTTTGHELYLVDLTKPKFEQITLLDTMDSKCSIVSNEGGKLLAVTNIDAPNNRMVKIDINNPEIANWVTVIPETEFVLNVSRAGEYLFANYMKNAVSFVKQYDLDGGFVRDVELPGIGTASGFSAKKEEKELYYSFTNYITPSSVYKLNLSSGLQSLYFEPSIDFNSNKYTSEQIFYVSKDGTQIPMIITYKKGLKLNGKNPTILYGYGGFNISLTPNFSVANAVWLENGGIYAVANLRGGGEYGKKWHDAGTQMNKQNVFNDCIAAAEYLIANKYTNSDYLAIKGGSNGGLLVGACITQHPDLFKVALPAVGVLDMLRYHTFTAGAGWAYDYGTSEQSKEMFEYIKGYSPVHNVKKGVEYPATLVTTGDHDDRVVPAHSFKFVAELQEKQTSENPVMIRVAINAGHGDGKSTQTIIDENVDILTFTLYNMGIKKSRK